MKKFTKLVLCIAMSFPVIMTAAPTQIIINNKTSISFLEFLGMQSCTIRQNGQPFISPALTIPPNQTTTLTIDAEDATLKQNSCTVGFAIGIKSLMSFQGTMAVDNGMATFNNDFYIVRPMPEAPTQLIRVDANTMIVNIGTTK